MHWGMAVIAMFAAGFYFLPALLACDKNHHQTSAILILNLLLGWTAIGWIGALIWSFTHTPNSRAIKWKNKPRALEITMLIFLVPVIVLLVGKGG